MEGLNLLSKSSNFVQIIDLSTEVSLTKSKSIGVLKILSQNNISSQKWKLRNYLLQLCEKKRKKLTHREVLQKKAINFSSIESENA